MKYALLASLLTIVANAQSPGLTIYNQNFAVVRQNLKLDLKAGVTPFDFTEITARLEPESVVLRDPLGKRTLRILEQNYESDPVSQDAMLNKFEGQTIDFLVNEQTVKGKIIRAGHNAMNYNGPNGYVNIPAVQPIIEINGKLRFGLPGTPSLSNLGSNPLLNPTLSWKLESPVAGPLNAELSYITGGMTWRADYNLVSAAQDSTLDLVGWVTMQNDSGRTFENARIKLMAGDVSKVQPSGGGGGVVFDRAMNDARATPVVTEKAFDEYHLYTLERASTLHDHETKQVEFLNAANIRAVTEYVYDGMKTLPGYQYDYLRQNRDAGTDSQPKVTVMQRILNSKSNGLGLPLPKGRVRFYRRDSDGQMEFIGENNIDHTPTDETLRIYTGNAFDLIGERRRTNYNVNMQASTVDESYEIHVRNHKTTAADVTVVEHLFRSANWTIAPGAVPFSKTSSNVVEFHVSIPAGGEQVINYSVHYTW